ncbi:MAG: chemotaxis response regulator protein-glutamate methylesterase [Candidatus Nanopelagicales bacterium]
MEPIRVLIVDDTVIVRRLVTQVLQESPDVEVVGTASHGRIALAQIPLLKPDVVTLDIEMPVMDGLQTLEELRKQWPDLPVIMFSTLTERGAEATLDALALGANDYVTKPSQLNDRAAAVDAVRSALLPLVRHWGRFRQASRTGAPGVPARPAPSASITMPAPARDAQSRTVSAVVIGISTGGPNALASMIPQLPAGLPVPIFIVQHMPPVFTRFLAERLDKTSAITVAEAQDGMIAEPGSAYVATGGHHLVLRRQGTSVALGLDDGPMENSCRPAVDVTLRSAAEVYGSGVLAVVMTGMGNDGSVGAGAVRALGGRVFAQDEATSVVWGMPGHVVRGGYADAVLPLGDIAAAIATAATSNRRPVGMRVS